MPGTTGTYGSLLLFLVLAPRSFGQDAFSASNFPGIHAKAGSGAGLTISRGPGAIFANPANIIFAKFFEPDVDLGVSITNYTYQHTDSAKYGSASASVTSLQTTLGGTVRPILPLALSAAFIPMGLPSTKYEIVDVPYYVGDRNYTLGTMSVTQEGSILGGGAAYKVHPLITVGASLIYTSEKLSVLATEPNASSPFFDMIYAGSYIQFVVGGRADAFNQKVSVSFSYKSSGEKKYKGDYYLDTPTNKGADYAPLEHRNVAPASIGLGGEIQLDKFGAFGDFRYNQWTAGLRDRGLPQTATATQFQDSFQIALGGKYWLMKEHMLLAGFGFVTPNVGEGSQYGTKPEEGFDGLGLLDLEGLQRLIFSGGYRYRIKSHGYVMAGGQFQTGTRSVPEGIPYEGTHSLSMILASVGGAYGF